MAAIMFEQAILRELENQEKRKDTKQIGSDVLRKLCDIIVNNKITSRTNN